MTITPSATFQRDDFLEALAHCMTVIERRSTLPVLSTVLLTVEADKKGQRLRLDATNLDADVSRTIPVTGATLGAVALNAATLARVLKALPKRCSLTMSPAEADTRVSITDGDTVAELYRYAADEFPVPKKAMFAASFSLPSTKLRWLIETSAFAISDEETRHYLNGLYLHHKAGNDNNVLRAVTTNGHTLARLNVTAPEGSRDMPGVIIPRTALRAVLGMLSKSADDETEVKIRVGAAGVSFATKNCLVTSKVIDGTFPDYERAIPLHTDHSVTLRASDIERAVKLGRAIHPETNKTASRAVKLEITPGTFTVTAATSEGDLVRKSVPGAKGYAGPGLSIGFNSTYALQILSRMKGADVALGISDSASPSTWRIANRDDALFVAMPMRL